eukprot:CAMPEP_0197833002 /NCGR_PEP_ID=MMETSP1437-20131217/17229_1 /TAXON_ID=49252 ORGANISM="Eucampia antarctica, Strain CCMP1452" /NCGR_SAMPLE_ID=MMETSP1437 /ASSEMBLY_ACC=CAM_ASM_001096 /LENGTH=120 /DNA_ID=CAMNT_0043436721 /DNA_START=209 /DNA_END=571 /DNA_ORIENTATION=+
MMVTTVAVSTNAFSFMNGSTGNTCIDTTNELNRGAFLRTSFAAITGVVMTSSPAYAKDVDPKLKGTKEDPGYQNCISKCVYECTKPKGDEQKTRLECIPDCKKECATNKAQLMIGTPKQQ